jgi:uncharacterized protein (DUF302 family)
MRLNAIVKALAIGALGLLLTAPARAADQFEKVASRLSYDDAKFELVNAITGRGLTIDYSGNVGRMLDRTGADVGSTRPLYRNAEFFTFCSAKLSRQTMEVDIENIALCPYVVFIYEAADKPGQVVVGYRKLEKRGKSASEKAIQEVNKLLAAIVKDAAK